MKENNVTPVLRKTLTFIFFMTALDKVLISASDELGTGFRQTFSAESMTISAPNNVLKIFPWLLPLLIGAIIAVINQDAVNAFTEKIEQKIRNLRNRIAPKQGRMARFVLKPLLWIIVKLCDWTDSFAHRGLKNGVRVAVTLYILAFWLFLLYAALIVVVAILVIMLVVYILLKFLPGGETEDVSVSTSRSFRESAPVEDDIVANVGLKGKKIYAGTHWFNEEMKGRIDDRGNIYKGTSWVNEEKVGRIDENGNIYKGTGSFNEQKVGKIDDQGTIYKGSNWFSEEKIGRIDEEGRIFKGKGPLSEQQQGRTKD